MADVATLALLVDATDAKREIALTREELIKLANGGTLAQKAVAGIQQPLTQTTTAAQAATFNFNKLRQPLTTLAVTAGALPGPLGRVASTLAPFALGGGLTVGVLAGISAIGFAWEKATEKSRKAREEWEKQLDLLRQLRREQELGPLGETGAAVRGGRARLGELGAEIGDLSGAVSRGEFIGPVKAARLKRITAEYTEIALAVQAGERDIVRIQAEAAEERARVEKQKHAERLARLQRELALQRDAANAERGIAQRIAQHLIGQHDERAALMRGAIGDTSSFGQLSPEKMFEVNLALEAFANSLADATAEAERIKKQREQQIKDAKTSVAGNIAGGLDSHLGTGGLFSGVVSGIASANPFGIGASVANTVFSGFIDALFESNKAADAHRQTLVALTQETAGYTDQLEVLQGVLSSVESRARAVAREYAAERERLDALIRFARENPWAGMSDDAERWAEQLDALNALERTRIAIIEEEVRIMNERMAEDLRVRLLRLQGRADEAAALELAIQHNREWEEALKNAATAANLATLAEVHRLEKIDLAMAQFQARIDSLAGTIGGLQDFRNSLLVSATQSPAARLAEARRQYAEVLAIAQGDDLQKAQEASGRLPGIAQILLDASRGVHASGPGFQSDFDKVLADSAALIQRFQDLKTIEELMLEELKAIRDNTFPLKGDVWTPPGGIQTLPASEIVEEIGTSIVVLQTGFTQLLGAVNGTNARLDDMEGTFRRGFDGIAAGSLH